MLRTFWNDDNGFIVSAELVLIATLLVIGLIVGVASLQAAMLGELSDLACAIGSLNQSYSVWPTAVSKAGHVTSVGGSLFSDEKDQCDCAGQCSTFFCDAIVGEVTHP